VTSQRVRVAPPAGAVAGQLELHETGFDEAVTVAGVQCAGGLDRSTGEQGEARAHRPRPPLVSVTFGQLTPLGARLCGSASGNCGYLGGVTGGRGLAQVQQHPDKGQIGTVGRPDTAILDEHGVGAWPGRTVWDQGVRCCANDPRFDNLGSLSLPVMEGGGAYAPP